MLSLSWPASTPSANTATPLPLALLLCFLISLMLLLQLVSPGWARLPGYAAIHTMLEILSIAMSLLVAVMAWFRTDSSRPLRVLAVGFAVIAALDTLHTVSYALLPAFVTTNTPQKAIVLWLGARAMVALAILCMLLPPPQQRRAIPLLWLYGALVAVLGVGLYGRLPVLYQPGSGLTALKIALEWLLVGGYLLLAFRVHRAQQSIFAGQWLTAGLLVLAFGELFFCFYQLVDDVANGLGHVFKVIGQGFFLRGVIETRLLQPYQQLTVEKTAHEEARNRLHALVSGAPLGILVVDQDGRIVSSNPAAEQLFHAAPGALDGGHIDQLVPSALRGAHRQHRSDYHAAASVRRMSERQQVTAERCDGSQFHASVELAPLHWGQHAYVLAFVSDISVQVQQTSQLQWLALNDELTGLPNRHATIQQLDASLQQCPHGALLLCNIDALGRINQVFGHDSGDALLVASSQRLQGLLHPDEQLTRLQGDSFAVLMPGQRQPLPRAQQLLEAFAAPFVLPGGIELQASARAGYCRYPEDGNQAGQLLQYAEMAMTAAKRSVSTPVVAFRDCEPARTRRWLQLAGQMALALQQQQFSMVYQPRVRLRDGSVAGFEALLRWQAAEGAISPGEFIPVAEETGFILRLGRWTLDQAIAQRAAWQRDGYQVGRMAINLSPRQLGDAGLQDWLLQSCQRHGVAPAQLELEITETAAMENLQWALPVLQQLRGLGLHLALDDFGTGYSSLAYLQQLPVSVLKIDLAFVRNLDREEGRAVARTIITLAQQLACNTVAEGVETPAQQAWLLANGCDEMQGFLEARPLPPAAVADYLRGKS